MLEYLSQGYRIINIDETFIGSTNYTRKHWQSEFAFRSIVDHKVSPRISMIIALDNYGDVYMSVS